MSGIDVRALPLTAVEGFVMSRIDGRSSVMDIVALTGLGLELVSGVLDKLQGLGAVRYRDAAPAAPASPAKHVEKVGPAQVERPFSPAQRDVSQVVRTSPGQPAPRPAMPPAPRNGPPSGSFELPSERPTALRDAPASPSVSEPPHGRSAPASGHSSLPHSEPPSGAKHASARRRASMQPPPRRLMSEAGYSTPPAELRNSGRPAAPHSSPPTGRTRALTPGPGHHDTTHKGPSRPPEPERLGRPAAPPEEQKTQPRAPIGSTRVSSAPPSRGPAPSEPSPASPPSGAATQASTGPARGAALYDPRELEEEAELPLERRKQLLDFYYRLADLDYYELLGVPYHADKKDIRAAYFALSKVFHPDSMFRKSLGSFKPKMEAVFQALTEAYETLGKKKNRDEYDAYLRATKATQMAEAALRRQLELEAAPVVEVPPAPAAPVVPATPESDRPAVQAPPMAPPRDVSPEARKLAQEVIARRLKGVVSQGRVPEAPQTPTIKPPPTITTSSAPPGPRTDPQELLRRLTRTLKDVAQFTGTNDNVTRAIKASQTAFAKGELAVAAQHMSKAISLAPQREDLRVEYERISKALSEKLASDYAAQAAFEQKSGKWASAALSWAKVCEGRPNDFKAHLAAANALLKAGGDLRGAQKYAQQAVFLAPDDIDARLLLTQIYMTIGLKLNARRELDAAAKLDPKHEMVKNLLADLKG